MPFPGPDLFPGEEVFPGGDNPIAERIYEELAPLTYADEANGFVLKRFIEAWTNSMVEIDNLVRDSDQGPGWSTAIDADRAPEMFLDFISQFFGIRFNGGETPQGKRDVIKALVNLKRGSPEASRAVILGSLTGADPYVLFNERQGGSAYRYAVRTKASETPDPDRTLVGLQAQKPAGLILDYATITGMLYDTIKAGYDTYTLSYTDRTDYTEWGTELPPT